MGLNVGSPQLMETGQAPNAKAHGKEGPVPRQCIWGVDMPASFTVHPFLIYPFIHSRRSVLSVCPGRREA